MSDVNKALYEAYGFPTASDLFVGREKELSQLVNWGRSERPPLFFVVGPKGIGKTTLVQRYLELSKSDYSYHIVINAEFLLSLDYLWLYIRSMLGEPFDKTADRDKLWNELYSRGKVLIVIDNLDKISYGEQFKLLNEILAGLYPKERRRQVREIRCLITLRPRVLTRIRVNEPLSYINTRLYDIIQLKGFSVEEIQKFIQIRAELYASSYKTHFDEKDIRNLSNLGVNQLGGNPWLFQRAASIFLSGVSPKAIPGLLGVDLTEGLTNLLLIHSGEQLRVIPSAQLEANEIRTPSDSIILVAPYVSITRLRSFWKSQLDEFEKIINDPKGKEKDYQLFFEKNPQFLEG